MYREEYDRVVSGSTFKGDPDRCKRRRDDNALGFMWRPGQPKESVLVENCTIDANGVAEGLKLSYCHDVMVRDCEIIGGYEDCVDIVRGGNITFERCRFISNNTKHHFTIKCMVDGVNIIDCTFVNDFRTIIDGAFVDLGNWGDYDKEDLPKTKNILVSNCTYENVSWWKKIICRRLYAENPKINTTEGVVFKVPSIFIKIFWYIRRKQTKT